MSRSRGNPLGIGRAIILLVCAIVFCGCAAYLAFYGKENLSAEKTFDTVAAEEEQGLEKVYRENGDTVAWVEIDDTRIDYPVMQTTDEPKYYLHRDFNKAYSEAGTPFVDGSSYIDIRGISSNRVGTCNWLVHGHNMKFGTMFHDLLKYEDESFHEEHPEFRFDVISAADSSEVTTREGSCRVFAACRSRIRDKGEGGFRYYRYGGITDEETFNEYIEGVRSEALYDTGINPQYGDQLVTLSTCAYHTDNGRFYVVGILK